MNKVLSIFMLFWASMAFAQQLVPKKINDLLEQNTVFKNYSVLNASSSVPHAEADQAVKKATYAKINMQGLSDLMAAKSDYIEVDIPYQGNLVSVLLYKADIFAEGFHLDTDQSKKINYERGLYYRGIIKGDSNSIVAFNFFNGELNAIVSSKSLANLVIGKLVKENNTTDYIVYSDSDLKVAKNFTCSTKEDEVSQPTERTAAPSSTKCVTVYLEVDNTLYEQNGNNITLTTNWATSAFNNVQTLFNNDGITIALKSMFIWTTPDPYEGIGTTSSDYMYKFNDVSPAFDGDVGQLIGIDPGFLGGVAVGINGICTQNNFSYSRVFYNYETVPEFSNTIFLIAHELGHLMGSPHTHACVWNGNNTAIDGCAPTANIEYAEGSCAIGPIPSTTDKGTLMSYCHLIAGVGVNFANGFGPQPTAKILAKVNAGTCLSTDCINTCINTVANITMSNVTTSSATVNWTDKPGVTQWQIAISQYPFAVQTWFTVNTPTWDVGGLTANIYYIIRIRPVCGSGLTAPSTTAILITAANYCAGAQITDTGGASTNYRDSESYIRTIIPNQSNKRIALTFTAFDLEKNYDYLYIYNGNSTAATSFNAAGYTDNVALPGPFVSTAADGSLTMRFFSDGGVTAAGYVANVTCENALANGTFEPNIDFTYFPNPTQGQVTIMSKTNIGEIIVYNIEGRLLYQHEANSLEAKVDVSAFANGTYFFKLKFGDKEANFKILKMN